MGKFISSRNSSVSSCWPFQELLSKFLSGVKFYLFSWAYVRALENTGVSYLSDDVVAHFFNLLSVQFDILHESPSFAPCKLTQHFSNNLFLVNPQFQHVVTVRMVGTKHIEDSELTIQFCSRFLNVGVLLYSVYVFKIVTSTNTRHENTHEPIWVIKY